MKAKEVLRLLQITRPTLTKYVKTKILKVNLLPNKQYCYDENSVYTLLNKDIPRKSVIYTRVSTPKQKKDLENQIALLKQYCFNSGIKLNGVYSDTASGISFVKRKEFFLLLEEILTYKIQKVIITYKDRLSRVGFELFQKLFEYFGTEIVVISEVGNPKLDSEEIFEEIVSLLHCYAMRCYSKRKDKTIKELISES